MANINLSRTNQTIIIDYGGKLLLFTNASLTSDGTGSIDLITDFSSVDYNSLRKFCDDYHERLTIQINTAIYKKEVRIIFGDFHMLLYGAFVKHTNIDYDNKLELGLSYDHIEYAFDSDMFNNYLPYLRKLKLKRIRERMKKQLVMN